VNILGHIFENSLNEIDEIKSEIEGQTVDKTKTRRKKDGVFYTPKYITKYIVDNTVGKLCTEKKAELKLVDEDYTNDKKIQTKTKKAHLDKLTDYRTWLLQLTICDPACGSGAFLNQALEFLIAEHRYVDELQAKLMGDSLILSDVENSILENNIYGVDLNDESVEIAKLSLWLRTAQKGRKLNSLNNNIKCGNSLIDDPEVAGDKAFSWEKEFPSVFPPLEGDEGGGQSQKRGFDVVIGNPPYVPLEELNEDDKKYIKDKFPQFQRKYDTSVVFKIKCIDLLKVNGYLSFVTTVTWQTGENYTEVRKFLFNNVNLEKIINLPFNVFADAYVDTGIFILKKSPVDNNTK
jgi:type I restriction-modification system DNA methylase subunit